MADPTFNRYATADRAFDRGYFDEGLRQHMLRVFNYMGAGLVLTGLVAFMVSSSPALMQTIFMTPLKWVVMLAPLAFVMVLSFGINRLSFASAQAVFWAYCAAMGLSLSAIFLVFTGASIALTFFVTSATFLAMSLYGYTTKTDLTKMGSFLMMGVFGIIIAGLANLFFQSSALQFAISAIGVVIFTGLTAYDTQAIKEQYAEGYDRESQGKLAVMGALTLYLDFINLFQFLLQFLGQRDE
ncbi:Bax inhibitor-1/YccA family protein [Azospirillum rugosum]|uniref:FtsH-binding integral membrane protein n=1 Tax=Azospirillum rugosum TaxID=416170 RepID=A0ABS4SMZ8_9PROT|nr:Bax inhibitor-1/YccA family protein [Azospirillum rugosum]MBP2293938.1 FtsH-binding integral membrane protein [Azospirillum rugosum]MDQ0526875.1 FtsH-binding integral membrane protein [Azospirillum rugosum]